MADGEMEVFVGREQSKAPQQVNQPAHANVPKQIFRRFGAPLSRLVNL